VAAGVNSHYKRTFIKTHCNTDPLAHSRTGGLPFRVIGNGPFSGNGESSQVLCQPGKHGPYLLQGAPVFLNAWETAKRAYTGPGIYYRQYGGTFMKTERLKCRPGGPRDRIAGQTTREANAANNIGGPYRDWRGTCGASIRFPFLCGSALLPFQPRRIFRRPHARERSIRLGKRSRPGEVTTIPRATDARRRETKARQPRV